MNLLDNYKEFDETDSCYLDGRYFNLVLSDYPGLIRNPIYLKIKENQTEILIDIDTTEVMINDHNIPLIFRMIIETHTSNNHKMRHSNLLIYHNKILYRYEPHGVGLSDHDQYIDAILTQYFRNTFECELLNINAPVIPEYNQNCFKSGYCVAYVLKYAYDYINGRDYDPSEIKRFVKCVETNYNLPIGDPDIEYGKTESTLIGAAGGAVLGGIVGGPTGLVLGGLGGGAIGYMVGR
jgi:hypothetical protein